jgi:uncharacterized protein (TIGR03086 family)
MPIDTLAATQQAARSVLGGVSKGQLAGSSPCPEWDVATLIDHLVGAQYWFLKAISAAVPGDATADASFGDYRAAFDEVAGPVMDALSADGFATTGIELPFSSFTGAQFIDFVSLETLAHSWDVAKATSQDTDLAPEAAVRLLEVAQAMMGVEGRSESANFGPVRTCSPDAPAADRLAAYLGRRVD